MPTFIETVAEHSALFRPSFVLFKGPPPTAPVYVEPLGLYLIGTRRPNGSSGICPLPIAGEPELGRFMGRSSAFATMSPQGRPPTAAEAAISSQRKLCSGVGEILITDRRLCVVLNSGDTILGKVEERLGSVLVLTLPYTTLDSVELTRKKGVLGTVRDKYVGVMSLSPPAGFVLEPIARLDPGSQRWVKIPYSVLADTLIQAACDARLAIVSDERERARLQEVRAGRRDTESGMNISAWITPPDK